MDDRVERRLLLGMIGLALALIAFGSTLVGGCRRAPPAPPTPQPVAAPPPSSPSAAPTEEEAVGEFRIVGYVMDRAGTADEIQYDRLTHMNYAFLIPNEDGTVQPIFSPRKLKRLVTSGHEHGVKVLISIGGWGWDGQFTQLAADPASRSRLIGEIAKRVDEYGFDGVDMDWEYPDPGDPAQDFVALMEELCAAMRPQGKLVTAAVPLGPNAEGVLPEVFAYVDWLNIMAYDGPGENHSPYSFAVEALDYWRARGLPRAKTVLGLPFYGRPGGVPYKKVVQANRAAPFADQADVSGKMIFYNGIPTVQQKTRLAMDRAAGIMIWALTHDTSDETSLLRAIHEAAHGGEASPTPDAAS